MLTRRFLYWLFFVMFDFETSSILNIWTKRVRLTSLKCHGLRAGESTAFVTGAGTWKTCLLSRGCVFDGLWFGRVCRSKTFPDVKPGQSVHEEYLSCINFTLSFLTCKHHLLSLSSSLCTSQTPVSKTEPEKENVALSNSAKVKDSGGCC